MTLQANTIHYVRARHRGLETRESDWSNAKSFTTKDTAPTFESALIQNFESNASDYFGNSIAISGDGQILAIGTPNRLEGGIRVGAVYIYKLSQNTWTFQEKIIASNSPGVSTQTGAEFGTSVSLSMDGTVLVIGEAKRDDAYNDQGRVYVFIKDGTNGALFAFRQKMLCPVPGASTYFGFQVKITPNGQTLAIGAYGAYSRGRAYVWRYSTLTSLFVLEATLTNSSNLVPDYWTYSLDVSDDGNKIIAGCLSVSKVFLFEFTGSSWIERLGMDYTETTMPMFGRAVSISGDGKWLFIGIPGRDQQTDAGSIEIWKWQDGLIQCHYYSHGSFGIEPNWGFELQEDFQVANYKLGFSVDSNYDGSVAIVGHYYAYTPAPLLLLKISPAGVVTGLPLSRAVEMSNVNFGMAVAINYVGDTVVASSPRYALSNPVVGGVGLVHIFN